MPQDSRDRTLLQLMRISTIHVEAYLLALKNLCRIRQFIASHLTRAEHILYEYSVPLGGICYHHVGNCADKLSVLDNRAAAHECGQVGTTHFYIFLTVSTLFIKKIVFSSQIQCVSCDSDKCERDIFLDFSAFVGNVIPWTIPRGKF